MDDRRDVWGESSTITFRGDMEWLVRVFGQPLEEQLKECIHILPNNGTGAYSGNVRGIREACTDGLVKENDVGVVNPGVLIISSVPSFVRDGAGP